MVNRKTQAKRKVANQAQKELMRLGATLGELATATGKSRPAASYWMAGTKLPDDASRKAIHVKWPAVQPKMWDVTATARAPAVHPPQSAPAPPPSAPDMGDLEEDPADANYETAMRKHLADVEEQLQRAKDEQRDGDWVKYGTLKQKILNDLAKFTGQLTATDEARLTKSKRFVELKTVIGKALAPYPEASRAVEDALRACNA
ncbi:MAG TPA: hypothetical protein VLC09_19015 [Polyangiaceae bacterium]|nr:hypothetical protein [Polyangiaceae bacterium]